MNVNSAMVLICLLLLKTCCLLLYNAFLWQIVVVVFCWTSHRTVLLLQALFYIVS